jgi:hypothetical protein
VTYHTVFDTDPLLEKLRADPLEARQYLIDHNINYLLVNYGEIARLANSYGFGQPPFRDKKRATEFTNELKTNIEKMKLPAANIYCEGDTFAYMVLPPPP